MIKKINVCLLLCFCCFIFQNKLNAQLFGGQIKTKTKVTIPSSIVIGTSMYFVASVYDQDYLPYTLPGAPASYNRPVPANGINEPVTADYQGTITPSGITVSIPVTCVGSGTLPAFSTTANVPAAYTEDGISRDLEFSWASQSYTASTKSIAVKISSLAGILNAKKLDINAGIGNDFIGVLLCSFSYPYNSAGAVTAFQVRDIAGIPDRMFGLADNSGATDTHLMLYLPVVGEDGKIWLNNNLGADYSNIKKPTFNLAQQATSSNDYKAYGSSFQWGRKPDGHERINWNGPTSGSPVYGTVFPLSYSNTPSTTRFIVAWGEWRASADNTMWLNESSQYNPCPRGFRVPTNGEMNNLIAAARIGNISQAASSKLKIPGAGFRAPRDGNMWTVGYGYYWTSSSGGSNATGRRLFSSTDTGSFSVENGYSVRCIKN